jgi:uncharacterized membrane protein
MTGEVVVLLLVVLLMAALLHWLPTWRRRALWFSVTVPEGFGATAEARAALRTYRTAVWTTSAFAAGFIALGARLAASALQEAAIVFQALGAGVTYAVVRRRILPFAVPPSNVRSAAISTEPERLPGGAVSVAGPLGILGAAGLCLRVNWARLPERVPVHWALDGTPNGWAEHTWRGVYGPLIEGAAVSLFVLLLAEAIIHLSPRARVSGTEDWTRRFRRATVAVLVAAAWGMSALVGLLSLTPLVGEPGRPTPLAWLIPLAFIAAILPFTLRLVRVANERDSGADGLPDAGWKFGLFYYNPRDSALMVEKRFGVGYTVNFGNSLLWCIAGLAALVVLLVKVAW